MHLNLNLKVYFLH